MIAVLFWLQVKHFVVDFPLQPKWMYANKGTYLHKGGNAHAALHGIATFLVLWWFIEPQLSFALSWLEALVHYHIDWAKMYLNKRMGWGPTTNEEFWWLLGFDQLLHQLTYLLIVLMVIHAR